MDEAVFGGPGVLGGLVFWGAWCYESARYRAGLSRWGGGWLSDRKGLVSSDVNHTGIEGPVKVRESYSRPESVSTAKRINICRYTAR
jgi:hypothetical protein